MESWPDTCYSVRTMSARILAAPLLAAVLALQAGAALAGAECKRTGPAYPCCTDEAASTTAKTASAAAQGEMPCCVGSPKATEPVEATAPSPAPALEAAEVVEASVIPSNLGTFGPVALGALAAAAATAPLFLKNRNLRN